LRTYRHFPNTSPRKSWAAGDATSRAVQLALMTLKGEIGLPSVLTAPKWGFYDVLFKGNKFKIPRPYGSYVMENILFKVSFPAEFHGQTAVECALKLHSHVKDRLHEIERIKLRTQEPAIRIISKTGALHNSADRDHCLQYVVAVALIYGNLTADSYEDKFSTDPQIDALRAKMEVAEDPRFTHDYYDPDKRAIGNAVQVIFKDGTSTEQATVEFPIGHRSRRREAIPLLEQKFKDALATRFSDPQAKAISDLFSDQQKLEAMSVDDLMAMLKT
jgi:2-methylcitrate dehydratase